MSETDLLKVRSFGRTSLREVKRKLADLGLSLGMNVGDLASDAGPGGSVASPAPESANPGEPADGGDPVAAGASMP
jgi:hypothetical protein